MQTYLHDHFLTLTQLATMTQVEAEKIIQLIDAQCIPNASYTVETITCFNNALDINSKTEAAINYFAPSVINWINKALSLLEKHSLLKTNKLMRADFTNELRAALQPIGTTETYLEDAWLSFLKGIWGICLKEVSPQNIARKNIARHTIKNIRENYRGQCLNNKIKQQLLRAIVDFNAVAMPFDPYYYPQSSRKLEVEAAIMEFQL